MVLLSVPTSMNLPLGENLTNELCVCDTHTHTHTQHGLELTSGGAVGDVVATDRGREAEIAYTGGLSSSINVLRHWPVAVSQIRLSAWAHVRVRVCVSSQRPSKELHGEVKYQRPS